MYKGLRKRLLAAGISLFVVLIFDNQAYPQETREQAPLENTGQDSDQQISDFSLAGFNEQGKKSWDLAGKTADIFDTVIKLQDVRGNLYSENEEVKLTADKGDFDKKEGKVHLEEDVVITTSSGAKLTTDSLDWDRKKQIVNTKDKVNIKKENLLATAQGLTGKPNLNKVNLDKDVQVEILPVKQQEEPEEKAPDKTIITCDGPLEIDYEKNIATFKNDVKVDNKDILMYSDIMDVYFTKEEKQAGVAAAQDKAPAAAEKIVPGMNSKISKIFASGNVKIIKGENISYSDEATYVAADKKIILTGRPKLVLSSTEDLKVAFSGN